MFDSVGALSRRCLVKTLVAVLRAAHCCSAAGRLPRRTVVLNQSGSRSRTRPIRNGASPTRTSTATRSSRDGATIRTGNGAPSQVRHRELPPDRRADRIGDADPDRQIRLGCRRTGPSGLRQVMKGSWKQRRPGALGWAQPAGPRLAATSGRMWARPTRPTWPARSSPRCHGPGAADLERGLRHALYRLLLDDTGNDTKTATGSTTPRKTAPSAAGRRSRSSSLRERRPRQPPVSGGSTLKVMQWNIHQGYGAGRQGEHRPCHRPHRQQGPDIISFNEIMRYSSSSQPQMIADGLRARPGRPGGTSGFRSRARRAARANA